MKKQCNQRGFTLVELMTVILVLAILIALAAPSMTEILQRNTQEAALSELSSTLAFARSEAISRGQRVSICQSSDGANCSTTGGWSNGWIVFVDPIPAAAVGAIVIDAGEQILRVHGPLKQGIIGHMREGLNPGDTRTFIQFDSIGAVSSRGPSQAVFTVCRADGDSHHARGLLINPVGQIMYTNDSNGNGIENLSADEDLSCN